MSRALRRMGKSCRKQGSVGGRLQRNPATAKFMWPASTLETPAVHPVCWRCKVLKTRLRQLLRARVPRSSLHSSSGGFWGVRGSFSCATTNSSWMFWFHLGGRNAHLHMKHYQTFLTLCWQGHVHDCTYGSAKRPEKPT